MTIWTAEDLERFGNSDEIRIAAGRADGTRRTPRIIWIVRVGDNLYVRSAHGTRAGWYRGTQVTHEGWIQTGDEERAVTFEAAGRDLDEAIDEAYRSKYLQYGAQYVDPVTNDESHLTTIRLIPRS